MSTDLAHLLAWVGLGTVVFAAVTATLVLLFKRHPRGLGIVLFTWFLIAWWLQTWSGWREFTAEQAEHGGVPSLYGHGGYFDSWMRATAENWQSESWSQLILVVLAAYLLYKGSPESKE